MVLIDGYFQVVGYVSFGVPKISITGSSRSAHAEMLTKLTKASI
jgi:hypothetical protein